MNVDHIDPPGLIRLLDEVWRDIAAVCDGLSAMQWDQPAECPGWNVRDVVAHVIGGERVLVGEPAGVDPMLGDDSRHVRDDLANYMRWIARCREWDGGALLDEFRLVTGHRLDALQRLTASEWDEEGFTPEGSGPYRLYMEIRVFDCWYHDQDIREALDRPGFLVGPVADLSIGRIPAKALGYVVGKKVGAPPSTTVVFEITGGPSTITAAITVPPSGRAVLLDAPPATSTVRITTDRRTFTRLAGGRWSGSHARDHGTVCIEGDTDLGDRVVDNLSFTI